jgi:hypothetical protein
MCGWIEEAPQWLWRGRAMLAIRTMTNCLIEYVAETSHAVEHRTVYQLNEKRGPKLATTNTIRD